MNLPVDSFMVYLKRNLICLSGLKKLIQKIKSEIEYRKKIKELKKKDPFIYH
jgi:hypothetical protein